MARRLDSPNEYGGMTDHSEEIERLRQEATTRESSFALQLNLAADLLEAHDQTGISLDDWPYARRFVERHTNAPVIPNLV